MQQNKQLVRKLRSTLTTLGIPPTNRIVRIIYENMESAKILFYRTTSNKVKRHIDSNNCLHIGIPMTRESL